MSSMDDMGLTYRDYARLARRTLDELSQECVAEAFHASGPGGQGVNTADSAVRMRHVPTGIVVVSRESRSQYRNRQICLRKIHEELLRRAIPPTTRHKTRPTRSSVERRLSDKRHNAETKRLRRRPDEE